MKRWRLPPVTARAFTAAARMLKHFVPLGARRREGRRLWRRRSMRPCTKSGWTEAANGSMPSLVLLQSLPGGAVIVAAGEAYTIAHGRAFRWTGQGYQAAQQIPLANALLTPPSTLHAIRAGYRPLLHPDIEENPDF
jgi:hypothetical protein